MRKLAGATTPCQSKAAVTRLMRSPPAAKKLATAKMTTSARSAIGSRMASRGDGQPALSLRADNSARSTWARQSACATGSCRLAAISSATAVAGRCILPLLRSSRRKPSMMLGSRTIASGAAAMAVTITNSERPMARASGGSTSHNPAQENARNSPSAVASVAKAGHSRSQNRLPRARLSARASRTRVGCSCCFGCSSKSSKSRSVAWAKAIPFDRLPRRQFPGHARASCA